MLLLNKSGMLLCRRRTASTTEPLLWWKFDDGSGTTAADASGHGYVGDLTNGPTWGTGMLSGAVVLDGTNDCVIGNTTAGILDGASAATITAWVKYNALDAGAFIAGAYDGTSSTGWGIENSYTGIGDTNDLLIFVSGSIYCYSNANLVSTVSWYHIAVVFDGSLSGNSNRLKLYVNGTQATLTFVGTIPATLSTGSHKFSSGGLYNVAGGDEDYVNGRIDDVRVYARALTSGEITALYGIITPGSQNYTTPGSYSFTVPEYNTLTVDVKGPGGGGGESGYVYGQGATGGSGSVASSFQSSTQLIGNLGTGGTGGKIETSGKDTTYTPGTPGAAGTATGGDTNTTGGGAAGGAGGNGGSPPNSGGTGGAGGRSQKTWTRGDAGAPAVGASITVVVGTKGTAGTGTNGTDGSAGTDGSVAISYA